MLLFYVLRRHYSSYCTDFYQSFILRMSFSINDMLNKNNMTAYNVLHDVYYTHYISSRLNINYCHFQMSCLIIAFQKISNLSFILRV